MSLHDRHPVVSESHRAMGYIAAAYLGPTAGNALIDHLITQGALPTSASTASAAVDYPATACVAALEALADAGPVVATGPVGVPTRRSFCLHPGIQAALAPHPSPQHRS